MSYRDYLEGRPVIVTAALTGGIHGKEANPAVPETPEEIAEAAAAAEDAGAAIVHLHARRETGERAFSTERFQAVTEAVRDRTDEVIIQHSTGGTGVPVALREGPLRTDPPPEMASLDMGPLNRYRHLTAENTRATVDRLYDVMAERGIKPELEVFNDGHRNEVTAFLDRRQVAEPVHLSLIFGGGTTTPAHPRNLVHALSELPERASASVIAFGRHQLPLTTMALVLGVHVRVGLEDNLHLRAGEPARSNAQLVARTVDLAERLERPVATPDEARALLGLSPDREP
ncbi:MAG: 3-keto-5-aminohexanoate cleavage protein [Halobacteriota archaeon]